MNQRAMLIPEARFAEWYRIATATAGLTELDHKVLDAIAAYHRELGERGHALSPTIGQMAQSAQVRSIDISGAIRNLVGLALIAVKPGAGGRANTYLPALPRRVAASMLVAAVDDAAPPF